MPRTETGKLHKRLLRDAYWAGRTAGSDPRPARRSVRWKSVH